MHPTPAPAVIRLPTETVTALAAACKTAPPLVPRAAHADPAKQIAEELLPRTFALYHLLPLAAQRDGAAGHLAPLLTALNDLRALAQQGLGDDRQMTAARIRQAADAVDSIAAGAGIEPCGVLVG